MNELQFFVCEHCGNIIEKIHDAGVPVMCCGQKMTRLIPGTVEASAEKHIPAVTVEGDLVKVQVGSVLHPMLEEHHIAWIWLETTSGVQRRALVPGAEPTAEFALADGEKPVAVYEYCNLHGLWKADV
ncbi:MAG: desulfoferrodoxin [Ruminococcaceae bacterium]|nr:desulfoferrodoxin [Oscillospiraceae bacterium]